MNQSDVEAFVERLADVQREEAYDTIFYFVGDDHRLPFVSISQSDNEYDRVSNLNREGVFRLNIGVSRETFDQLLAGVPTENLDYSVLDTFLPHPDYAKQNFVCILTPSQTNEETTKRLILEAHGIVAARAERWSRRQ
ncbi:MAG: hypothetical protein IPK19_04145 [Chloroflexi bacterium]|nr:hypothetical protein [Chloroflexota bacterium]